MLDFNTLSSKRHKLLKSNNKLFAKSRFVTNANGVISRCYWACVNSTKGCKAKVRYSIDQAIAGANHDGMSSGIINIEETEHNGEYCTTNAIDIVVRVARNAIIEKATEGSLYSNCICLFVYYMLIFSYTNSSGVDLTVAYASIMNPIQLANPVAAGNMPSCDALQSAYSRRRLSMFPRIPHNYDDIDLPAEYKLAESGRNFLLFNDSFPSLPGGLVDNHIMCFGTKTFSKNLLQAKRVHMDGTFKVCPEPFAQLFTLCSFHRIML